MGNGQKICVQHQLHSLLGTVRGKSTYIYIYVNILVYMIHEGFIPLFFWRIDDLNYEPCMPILFVGECSLLLLTDGMIPTIPKVFLDQRS